MEVEDHHYALASFDVSKPFRVSLVDDERALYLGDAPVTGELLGVRTPGRRPRSRLVRGARLVQWRRSLLPQPCLLLHFRDLPGLTIAYRHDGTPKRPAHLSKVYSPTCVDRSKYFSDNLRRGLLGSSSYSGCYSE